MRYLINLFKNKGIIIILAALATIVGFLYFWARGAPEEKVETPTLPTLPAPVIKQQSITAKPQISGLKGKFANFPNEMVVYQIDSPKISHQQAIAIAGTLGFAEAPAIFQDAEYGPVYNWSSAKNYLSITVNRGLISYGLDLLGNPGILEGELASLEEIKTITLTFLENQIIPLPKNLRPTMKQIQYLKVWGPTYKEVGSREEADVAQVDLEFKIGEIEIIPPMPDTFPLTLRVGPEMKIVSIDYQSPFGSFEVFNSYPLKTERGVLENIEAMPRVSHLQFTSGYLPTKEDYQKIRTINFDDIKLSYYQPLLPENYLQPVFLISGKVQLRGGQTGEAFLYLPAVSEEYLTPGS